MSTGSAPPGFPSNIPVQQERFQNWSNSITVPAVWTCTPASAQDVVTVCNWAAGAGWTVRPRGIMHNWSPLTVINGQSPSNVLLVDLTTNLNQIVSIKTSEPYSVKVQCGATMEALVTALEKASGGVGSASGFAFSNIPAPGHITVGGALAINAHGTAVHTPPNDDFFTAYGSLSNQIMAFTAVVTADPSNPKSYSLQSFDRVQGDARAFLTHVGRAFLVDVTLDIVDNYNLRCQSFMDIPNTTLFAAPSGSTPPPQSVGDFLEQSGRIEVIWFPSWGGTSYPWLKVWTVAPQKPASSRAVSAPYNYPFSDTLPEGLTGLLDLILSGFPEKTPDFCSLFASITAAGLTNSNATDLWGPSKNTLLYVKDSTLRVTANGYAVLMKKQDVQQAVSAFAAQFTNMLNSYANRNLWPINSPLEIRVTNLDDPFFISTKAQTPAISSLNNNNQYEVAAWFDVLTVMLIGDSQRANEFYSDLETWFDQQLTSIIDCRVMPEWSKGWAYTPDQGPWTNQTIIENIRKSFKDGADWDFAVQTLAKYDASNLFVNPFLQSLFVT